MRPLRLLSRTSSHGSDDQCWGHEWTWLYQKPSSWCLWRTVQNNPESSRQVTPTPPPPPPSTQTISKHLFWATATLCASQWKTQGLTVHWLVEDFNYTLHNVHCARQKLTIFWQRFLSFFFFLFLLNLKSSGSEGRGEGQSLRIALRDSDCFRPSPIMSISITLHVKHRQWRRGTAEAGFFLLLLFCW